LVFFDLWSARDMLETNPKSHPDQFSARLRLGRIYLRSNDAQSAVVQFEAAQLMRPESVEGTVDLAKALIAQGNFADAVKILHEAADSSTKNPEVSGLLAKVCTELEQQTGTTAAVDRVTSICKIKTNHDNFAANSSRTTC
jgi:cytochrome c-type biogenesis protein CcmH/NrfG